MKLYLTGVLFLITSTIAQGQGMVVVEMSDTSITLNGKEVIRDHVKLG